MSIKGNKGVTLIALTITVILIMIITSATIFSTKNNILIKRVENLKSDIELLTTRVDDYYLKYGELPILCDYAKKNDFIQNVINGTQTSRVNIDLNENDGNRYVVIDLEKLGGLTLNFGYNEQYKRLKETPTVNLQNDNEIYVINTKTHQIYFPHGIFVDNIKYITF